MAYESSSAASEVVLGWFGLRIIRAVQPSAAGGNTGECLAEQSRVGADRRERNVAIAIARRTGGETRSDSRDVRCGVTGHVAKRSSRRRPHVETVAAVG